MSTHNPTCYMMMGLPGSGKSTRRKNEWSDLPYVSLDKHVHEIAGELGVSYGDVFKMNGVSGMKLAENRFRAELSRIIEDKDDFVWDQTNLTVKTRQRKLTRLRQNGYQVVAVPVDTPVTLCWERNIAREDQTVPKHVFDQMVESYVHPTLEEGFVGIRYPSLNKDDF